MSDSVRPHRWQPTRLPRPWDSPGKNTGVGCHFLLQCMKVKSESEVAQLCPTLSDPTDCGPPGSSVHGIFQARVLEWGAIAFSLTSFYLEPKLRITFVSSIYTYFGNSCSIAFPEKLENWTLVKTHPRYKPFKEKVLLEKLSHMREMYVTPRDGNSK